MNYKQLWYLTFITAPVFVYSSHNDHTSPYSISCALFPLGACKTVYDGLLGYVYYPAVISRLEKKKRTIQLQHDRDVVSRCTQFKLPMNAVSRSFRHETDRDQKHSITGIPQLPPVIFQQIMHEHFPLQKGSDVLEQLALQKLVFAYHQKELEAFALQKKCTMLQPPTIANLQSVYKRTEQELKCLDARINSAEIKQGDSRKNCTVGALLLTFSAICVGVK